MLRYTTDRARPGLVALYDIRPGNGAGQFLQPRSPHGALSSYKGLDVLPVQTSTREQQRLNMSANWTRTQVHWATGHHLNHRDTAAHRPLISTVRLIIWAYFTLTRVLATRAFAANYWCRRLPLCVHTGASESTRGNHSRECPCTLALSTKCSRIRASS